MFQIKRRIIDFCNYSSIHGFKFLFLPNLNFIERILWLGLICISWYGVVTFIAQQISYFRDNRFYFGVETNYLEINYEFPSVFVCPKKLNNLDDKSEYWMDKTNTTIHRFNIIYSDFPAYGKFKSFENYCSKGEERCRPITKLSYLLRKVNLHCNSVFNECRWNGDIFECCKYFFIVETTAGICYALNNENTRVFNSKKNINLFPMKLNRTHSRAIMELDIKVDASVTLHDHHEYPSFLIINENGYKTAQFGFRLQFALESVISDSELEILDFEKRQCRFAKENFWKNDKKSADPTLKKNDEFFVIKNYKYQPYSEAYCLDHCLQEKILSLCNCTPSLSGIPKVNECTKKNFKCLYDNREKFSSLLSEFKKGDYGVRCKCISPCNTIKITELSFKKGLTIKAANGTKHVILEMIQLPFIRYRRSLTRNPLDIVVSLGGIVSLFTGASLLSFIELFYFFFIRTPKKTVE